MLPTPSKRLPLGPGVSYRTTRTEPGETEGEESTRHGTGVPLGKRPRLGLSTRHRRRATPERRTGHTQPRQGLVTVCPREAAKGKGRHAGSEGPVREVALDGGVLGRDPRPAGVRELEPLAPPVLEVVLRRRLLVKGVSGPVPPSLVSIEPPTSLCSGAAHPTRHLRHDPVSPGSPGFFRDPRRLRHGVGLSLGTWRVDPCRRGTAGYEGDRTDTRPLPSHVPGRPRVPVRLYSWNHRTLGTTGLLEPPDPWSHRTLGTTGPLEPPDSWSHRTHVPTPVVTSGKHPPVALKGQ